MARSRALAVFILALVLLGAFSVPAVRAQTPYTEKLTAYIAGSNALWYMTFGGINGSSKLTPLESVPGLSWYNITAIKTTGWDSDFQVFGSGGYGLLPVPFVPSQGVFLKVGSDSFTDASSAASAINSYMLTDFVSLSNGSGYYTFYSSFSYDSIVPSTLLTFLPTGSGGFANAIAPSSFDTTPSPMVVLEGMKSGSTFTHSLVVGSISTSALGTTDKPNLLTYFGSAPTRLQASNKSTSSTIQLYFLDGIVNASSSDHATVTSATSEFSGSYTLNLQPGKAVTALNATVVQQPVEIAAARAVDVGVLHTGGNLSVTISLKNLSPNTAIKHISFSDSWWSTTGQFKFLGGNDSAPSGALAAGASVTPVYRLQYTGTATGSFVIPASVVRFTYTIGSSTFNGEATLNPIRLSLGADDAVVFATVSPAGSLGKAVGNPQGFNVTVVNVGNLPANSIVVAGHSVSGLAASGGKATISVTQSALGILGINITRSYPVTYQDPSGNHLNATTNIIPTVFSHASMNLGYPTVVSSSSLSFLKNGVANLTLSFVTTNIGLANLTSFSATTDLPAGLGCGAVSGKGLSCSGDVLTLSYKVLTPSSTSTSSMKYNITSPTNYIIAPPSYSALSSGVNITGRSNGVAAPSGLTLSKMFTPSQLFGGMKTGVQLSASNGGPLPFYNVVLSTSYDSFDTIPSSVSLSKNASVIAPGGSVALSYNATILQESGNLSAAKVIATFYFGGVQYSIQASGPVVTVYKPVSASINTTPSSPIEGKPFSFNIQLTNPSGVEVSNVSLSIPLPSGISITQLQNAQVSVGTITMSAGSLAPYQSINATGVAVANSGAVIPFDNAKLSFTYHGVTVSGRLPSAGIAIGEDITTRYLLPIALVLVVLLATAFYVRRLVGPSARASQK